MRITFLTRAGAGTLAGGFKVITDYAEALQRAGHQVVMVSPPRQKPMFDIRGLRRLPLKKTVATRGDFLANKTFQMRLLDRDRAVTAADVPDADIVVASWYEAVGWMAALPPSKGAKVHFAQGYESFDHLPQRELQAAFDLDVSKIAVSSYVAGRMLDNHAPRDVRVVGNGVDTNVFSMPPSAPRDRIPGVLYTTAARKRIELAMDAIAAADTKAIGFGKEMPGPDGAAAFVRFRQRPDQAEIPTLYGACRAWLFPTESEGFGLPILEAMACGTPVIATRAGAAPDLIDGTNGVLVEPTPQAMAAQIKRFAAMDEPAWQAMSRAARATAEANTLGQAAKRFEAALTQIAAR